MARDTVLEGVFAINKPMGMSSAQVIRDCQTYFNPSGFFQPLLKQEADLRARESNTAHRRRSKAKRDMRVKMGHGGTLDPLATGVLILGVGRGTKELSQFLTCTKTYETVVLFGASTDTYDRVGRVLKRRPYDEVTRDKVEAALDAFRGRFRQMPPLYSALKMNGKPLYEYAREGLSIPREIETRDVEVSDLELVEWHAPGTHGHRWPAEEAGVAEQTLAERVWRMEREQAAGKKRSPEEEKSDREARAAHEAFKRRAEEKQDELVFDRPAKRRRGGLADIVVGDSSSSSGGGHNNNNSSSNGLRRRKQGDTDDQLLMSGALGELPSSPYNRTANGTPTVATPAAEEDAAGGGAGAGTEDPSAAEGAGAGAGADAKRGRRPAAPMQTPGGRGSNLIPPAPALNTPPPWEGQGPPAARIRLTVSSGFYVRSFCHDLGEKVGSAAMMAELARTRQSDFRVGTANVLEYDDIARGESVWAPKVARLLRLWRDGEVARGAEASEAEAEVEAEAEAEAEAEDGGDDSNGNGETTDAAKDTPAVPTPPEDPGAKAAKL